MVDDNDNGAIIMGYNVVDRPRIDSNDVYTGDLPYNLWNFNYCMALNHNFATRNARIQFGQVDGNSNNPEHDWLVFLFRYLPPRQYLF